jgi:hypothetical protein
MMSRQTGRIITVSSDAAVIANPGGAQVHSPPAPPPAGGAAISTHP